MITDSTDRSTDRVAIYSKLQIRDKNKTNILKYSNINKYKKNLLFKFHAHATT